MLVEIFLAKPFVVRAKSLSGAIDLPIGMHSNATLAMALCVTNVICPRSDAVRNVDCDEQSNKMIN